MSRKLNESFMNAISATRKRSGKRLTPGVLQALGASKGSLEESFARALEAVKGRTGKEPSSFFEISRKDIPASLSRKIHATFNKHLRKTRNAIDAYNKTLVELAPDIGPKRHLVGAMSRELMKKGARRLGGGENLEVRSVDAWRDPDGGWYENDSHRVGHIQLPPHPSNRDIIKALREGDFLSAASVGKVAVEEQGEDYYWLINRKSGKPIFALVSPALKEDERTLGYMQGRKGL